MGQNKGLSDANGSLAAQNATTSLWGGNSTYVEDLYERYLDGETLPADWQKYFATLPGAKTDVAHGPIVRELEQIAQAPRLAVAPLESVHTEKQAAVSRLIQIYMNRGHLLAKLDPLGLTLRPRPRVMDLERLDLTDADLDAEFYTSGRVEGVPRRAKLRDIMALLNKVFAGPIGAEFAHVSDTDERLWLQDQFMQGSPAAEVQQRRAHQYPAAADRGRRAGALPAHEVRRAEALLAGRRRCIDPHAERAGTAWVAPKASRTWSSAWRIVAASTCSSMCWARRLRTCSTSSRASTTSPT